MYQVMDVAIPSNAVEVRGLQAWLNKCEAAGHRLVCFIPTTIATSQCAVFHSSHAEALPHIDEVLPDPGE